MEREGVQQVLLLMISALLLAMPNITLSSSSSSSSFEKSLLLDFKHSISHPNTNTNTLFSNWDNQTSLCSWHGVSCSPANRLLYLDLSAANLTGDFLLRHLAPLPYLRRLSLRANSFSTADLSAPSCPALQSLDISANHISRLNLSAHTSCQGLTFLNLSRNTLHDLGFVAHLPGLKHLSLAHNDFSGPIPALLGQTLCSTLEELDLSGNNFSGQLPASFVACTSLSTLNLGANQLSGDFLATVVAKLQRLSYLYVPFNNISGTLPTELANCTSLRVLDLSSNALTGNVPSGFCTNSLEKILLANNYLSGAVSLELAKCRSLRTIDLSFNNLTGTIPAEIWQLPNILEVIMWANSLSGEIPEGICANGAGNLQMLILNNNLLEGTVPNSIADCTNMIWISLSSNRLTGNIPAGIGNLANLSILQMGSNSLSGNIPAELGRCRSLIWLDLNSNNISGAIPAELADQAGMVMAGIVSGKHFAFVRNEGGTACRGAGGLIEFEGVRAERLEMLPMVHSCSSTRIYSGMTVYTFASNGSMIYLDLSYNALSETIPERLGSMSYLQVLNLGHNSLSGDIPFSLGGLRMAGVMDLSHNRLQGTVPGSLASLSFLSDLDVSNNNLTGLIPSGGQLTTFPAARYENNSGLCGVPLPPCGSRRSSWLPSSHGRRQSTEGGTIAGVAVSVVCMVLLIMAICRIKKQEHEKEKKKNAEKEKQFEEKINMSFSEKPLRRVTFAELAEATEGFGAERLIGTGGFGEVYKANLSENVVAVKKLIAATGQQGEREFVAEMETIGRVKHRNLVALLGYCRTGDERLLVYEYMSRGSLEAALHEKTAHESLLVQWEARRRIAVGSARGLAFLHHSCVPHIIHRDMKSSNVLIDENLEARVSDFGMARVAGLTDTQLSVSTLAGTPGYVPPEYYQSFRCSAKGDVYSYGVVLLELVSGRRPIDPVIFGDDNNLVGWARQLHREGRARDIVDPRMEVARKSERQVMQYLRIALECVDERPIRRPTMIQVMAKFKDADDSVGCSNTSNSSSSSNSSTVIDVFDGFSNRHHVVIPVS